MNEEERKEKLKKMIEEDEREENEIKVKYPAITHLIDIGVVFVGTEHFDHSWEGENP